MHTEIEKEAAAAVARRRKKNREPQTLALHTNAHQLRTDRVAAAMNSKSSGR